MNEYKKPAIKELSQNEHKLTFNNEKELYLIGTAHVSAESVKLVEEAINKIKPDTICIELDEERYNKMKNKIKYQNINIIELLRKKEFFSFIGQLFLSAFQKKISEKTGSEPGKEFKTAYELAEKIGAKVVFADRNIGVTLKRAWRMTRFIDKIKLLFAIFSKEDEELEKLEKIDIENMKDFDTINKLVDLFGKELPKTKIVLIDERDIYLVHEIQENLGKKTVAVVGAGHVPGMLKIFDTKVSKEKMDEINFIPPKSKVGKILPWIIPLIVVGLFAWGFMFGRKEIAQEAIIYWVLVNGILTAIGCLIALGHPLTIIAGFIAAPITSLNPTIGAGFVTGIVQTFMVKPRVLDFEEVQKGSMKITRWWKNRLTKVFIVFLLSSIGSSIGTYVALPMITRIFL